MHGFRPSLMRPLLSPSIQLEECPLKKEPRSISLGKYLGFAFLLFSNGFSSESLSAPFVMKSKHYPLPIINMWTFYELDGKTKWIGPSADSLLNDTKGDSKAHAMAQNVRTWGKVKMVSLPMMLSILPAVPVYNDASEAAGIGLVVISVASLITFTVANGRSNAYVEKVANLFNESHSVLGSERPFYARKIQVRLEF